MKTLFIAVTGGIGSGKSTACEIIKKMGYTVISADETYSALLNNDNFIKGLKNVLELSADEVFDKNSLSKWVFDDNEKLQKLNAYTHAKIMDLMFEKSKGLSVVFHEVPLLFESGYQNKYDKIIVIMRDVEERINSIVKSRGLSRGEVEKRIKNQCDYEKISLIKHTVITNGEDLSKFAEKVKAVVNETVG